ncbi:molybdopterin-containing oxidoreductase family protein [Desulforhopalus singaporensis]|uniref:Thiosulfate reductase / polysulfide reductase chain A n=1 Tax=Desulforhopalus singaporensis TaxID=91360 RepID=A0A1H0PXN2_9BACT|nr:molybdopterin-dependent oxidoreductase [Desulforhopalus singaporensis]SDP09475.1 thiosulfate reductase / polysulfide reductase chain A [Desulforhopalus singaporensis]
MAFNLTRRKFLQSASLAAVALPLSEAIASETSIQRSPLESTGSFGDETVVGGVCEMCFWRCQLVGKKRGDRLIKLEGNPKSIDNGTSICARGNAGIKLLYDPDRLKYPLKNVGERGNPKWKRISWQEALDECGTKLKQVHEKYGAQGLCMFPHGSSAKYPMHFMERTLGTHNVSEASFYQCRGIRDTAYLATIGKAPGENVDMPNAKVIMLLGGHFGENVHVSHIKRYIKGLENGAKLIVVDPRFSASAAKSDVWVRIKPGTDTAFLLAIMNYLIINKKYDEEFVDEYGDGLEELQAGIKQWTLEKAAAECDIPAAQIKEVAELLAANSPNVSIHPGRHVSWYGNDFQRQRALACLTGLLGAFYVKGGWVPGKGPKVGAISWAKHDHGDEHNLNMNEDEERLYPYAPPGTPTELIRDAALTGKPYPIKGCVIWGQNPIQTIPGQDKMKEVLKQMDFVMCVDVMPTDVTMWADILLPEVSYLERYDYIKTGTQWDFADNHLQFIAPRMPLAEPMFERKDQVYITNEIARRMGFEKEIPVSSAMEMVEKNLEVAGLTLDQVRKEGGIHTRPGKDPYAMPEDFEVLFYNEDIEDAGFPGIPTYKPTEPPPAGYTRLLYGRVPVHTFNRTQNNVWLNRAMPENPVWINDELAAKMGLSDGDTVGLVNQDGFSSRTTTTVKTTPGIRKDAIYMAHGYGSANPLLTVGADAGVDDQSLITKITVDEETGAHGMRTNFVKLVKDGKVLDIPTSA